MSSADFLVSGFVFCGWIFSICLHEFGHAIVAYWGGDHSVKAKGYLTLNPFKYTNLITSVVVPALLLFLGGIPLPGATVYINEQKLRSRQWQSAVAAAGPLASAGTAIVLAMPFWLGLVPGSTPSDVPDEFFFAYGHTSQWNWIFPALALLITLDLYVAVLNLLPLPPLDGYRILEPWLPLSVQRTLKPWGLAGLLLLIGLLWTVPQLTHGLFLLAMTIAVTFNVPPDLIVAGLGLFHSRSTLLLFGLLLLLVTLRSLVHTVRSPRSVAVSSLDLLGWLLPLLKQPQAGLTCLNTAVQLNSQAPRSVWINRGVLLAQLGRYSEALQSFEQLMQIYPHWQDESLNPEAERVWLVRGIALHQLKQYNEAIASFKQALAINPDLANAWLMQGLALAHLRRYDEAMTAYDRLLQLQPSNMTAYVFQGELLRVNRQFAAALALYNRALQHQPRQALLWSRRADVLDSWQRNEEAAFSYRQALKFAPAPPEAHWQVQGESLLKLHRYEEVLRFCERYRLVLRGAGLITLLNLWGMALSRLQHDEEAIAVFNQAIQLQPTSGDTWYNKACHYAERKDLPAAIAHLQRALTLSPNKADLIALEKSFDRIRHQEQFRQLLSAFPPIRSSDAGEV